MSYRPSDYLKEHPLSEEQRKAIDNMTVERALGEVFDAARSWDEEVSGEIFGRLSEDEMPGYAQDFARREKAFEMVSLLPGMLSDIREVAMHGLNSGSNDDEHDALVGIAQMLGLESEYDEDSDENRYYYPGEEGE